MEQFDSSEEASSRVLEQQQRNDEQQFVRTCILQLCEYDVLQTARWNFTEFKTSVQLNTEMN